MLLVLKYCRRGNKHVCVVVCVELLLSWGDCCCGTMHVCVVDTCGTDVVVVELL